MLNREQGAQFTSTALTRRWEGAGIQISLDGRGRALDHVLVERLWRTVTDEAGYVKDDETPREAATGLAPYVGCDQGPRLHQALDDQTPTAVPFGSYV